ncbi:MAG: stress response protein [Hormoscilla sp.]
MTEITDKVNENQNKEEIDISAKYLMATLKWTAAVDLDLMAFYQAKDGRNGGIYSDNYAGSATGSLNEFPFIELSGDAGVEAETGEHEEVLHITKLEELAKLYICAVNFTDAVKNRNQSFSSYDASVAVVDNKGKIAEVSLDSQVPGVVAVIAKIDNTNPTGVKLVNENRIMDVATFQKTIPGANSVNLSDKVVLQDNGDAVQLKTNSGGRLGEISVNLNWHQKQQASVGEENKIIDLDLGCLFELTTGETGVVQPWGDVWGNFDRPPFIIHCGDDRTGASSEGETLRINGDNISMFKRILVYAYIYQATANWPDADAVATIKQPGQANIVVELNQYRGEKGICAIALLANTGETFSLKKVMGYFSTYKQMYRTFNWNMEWTPKKDK